MKKILITLLIILGGISVKAQIPGFAIKIMGGVNMPSFAMDQATNAVHKLNYAFSLDAALGKKNYLQAGLSIRKYTGEFTILKVTSDLAFPSFGMHAYYGRQFLDLKVTKLRAFGGVNYELLTTPTSKDFVIDPDDFNPNVVNLVVGGEVKVLAILLSLQYEIGLTDMATNVSMKNNIFIAKVGFSIL